MIAGGYNDLKYVTRVNYVWEDHLSDQLSVSLSRGNWEDSVRSQQINRFVKVQVNTYA